LCVDQIGQGCTRGFSKVETAMIKFQGAAIMGYQVVLFFKKKTFYENITNIREKLNKSTH